MKRITLMLCALVLAAYAHAQVTVKPGVGLNFTDFTWNSSTGDATAKTGWQIGGTFAFGKKVYFEPGIFYVGKSSEFSTITGQTTTVSTVDLKGIRIPVGLGINLLGNEKSTLSLRGFGGASAFFITSEDFSSTINNLDLKSTDFGLYAGAGIDIWKLFLDVSYEWSVTNIQEDVSQVDVGKSRNLWITGGLRLNF